MTEETKKAIQLALEILRRTLVDCGCSIAVEKETGRLNFFDTETYIAERRFDGINVEIRSLIN